MTNVNQIGIDLVDHVTETVNMLVNSGNLPNEEVTNFVRNCAVNILFRMYMACETTKENYDATMKDFTDRLWETILKYRIRADDGK